MGEQDSTDAVESLQIQPMVVLKTLLVMWLVVCLGGALVNVIPFVIDGEMSKMTKLWFRLLQLDAEANVPTLFSTLLLALNAMLLVIVAVRARQYARYWMVLAVIFCLLAVDETVSLHEAVGRFVSRAVYEGQTITYFWTLLAGPAVAVLLVYLWRFLFALQPRTRTLFLVSGAVYVGGALVFELFGWAYKISDSYVWAGYLALTFIEETMEMLGQILFCYALLDLLTIQRLVLVFRR
jgi:hypothetical protein